LRSPDECRATAAPSARGRFRHRGERLHRNRQSGDSRLPSRRATEPQKIGRGRHLPRDHPEKAIEVDGAIGELSPFHHEYGYYAHGVAPETATLPDGWEQRLVELQVNDQQGTIGLCLEKHDLAFSKLAAGREKDFEFIHELLKHRLINRGKLLRLIESVKDENLKRLLARNWVIVSSRKKK